MEKTGEKERRGKKKRILRIHMLEFIFIFML